MLRSVGRALAPFATIAALALLSSTASAQFRVHPPQQILGSNADDIGPNPEGPEEPAFGMAVAIRSELAFIGMPHRSPSGRVGVFTATPTELIRTATLTPSDAATADQFPGFGRTLTYRDGILVVGSGQAAYVFQRNSSGVWTERQRLAPPASDDVRFFANSLRYEDGTLAIGADTSTGIGAPFAEPGTVYIYQRNAAGQFIARGRLVSPDSSPDDGFGTSISMAGATMVVGSPGLERAYVFRRNSTGAWRWNQTLIASELAAAFGHAVAIDKGMIVVGAPGRHEEGDDLFEPKGAAYGFVSNGSSYVETFKLQPQIDVPDNRYIFLGVQVAMFDQRIVVGGMRSSSSDGHLNGTSVFSYTRSGSSVLQRGFALRNFRSSSLALADQRLVVGIACNRISSGFCPGEAILYRLNVFE